MNKTKFVQFSKRIVVAVTACVTFMCAAAIVFCWLGKDTSALVSVVRAYIDYAMVVFVSYSGNSIAEKYLKSKNLVEEDSAG